MLNRLNPTIKKVRNSPGNATFFLDELTAEDHGSLQRMVDAARKTTDHGELADLFRSSLSQSGERARAEIGTFLAMFRQRDADGADRFFETFKVRAGAGEAERIRRVADVQTARDRAAQGAQPTQMAQAQKAKPKPAQPTTAQAKPTQPPKPKPAESGGPRDDGLNPNFSRFRKGLKPWEGGFANRTPKADPGGPTQQGISQDTLDRLNKQNPKWGLPQDTKNLGDAQIDGIYRKEFFDKPNIQKVVAIPGLKQQAPRLAEQLFDTGVQHSPKRAGRFLQESLDQVLGTDLRTTDATGKKDYDGIVGSGTRAAIARAVREGKAAAVNNAMVDKRIADMRRLPNFKSNSGWVPRAESFRIPTP